MTRLREKPLRLEPSLTREYVDRRVKMAGWHPKTTPTRKPWSPFQVLALWVGVGIVLTFAVLVWWSQ